jgi:hypothetical protein
MLNVAAVGVDSRDTVGVLVGDVDRAGPWKRMDRQGARVVPDLDLLDEPAAGSVDPAHRVRVGVHDPHRRTGGADGDGAARNRETGGEILLFCAPQQQAWREEAQDYKCPM